MALAGCTSSAPAEPQPEPTELEQLETDFESFKQQQKTKYQSN
jgi:hypothetical protein